MWDQIQRGQRPGPAGTQTTQHGRALPDQADSADERDGETAMADTSEAALLLDALAADDAAYAALGVEDGAAAPLTDTMRRARLRAMIREFLRAVPRSEPETILALPRPDGETRVLTRSELTTAIDRLRPRMRQIVRLGIEERWPRQKVCAYLRGISLKTLERDQVEALDLLASM
ncbi:MAG TPA: hypothetical protein VF808_19500 [Ktedonobacterales bacterium]